MIFLLLIVSLAGVPPAFGFAAKFYLFLTLYQGQNFTLLAIVFFANLISLSYYIRLIRYVFFENPGTAIPSREQPLAPFSSSMLWAFSLLLLFHCFFGFWLLQVIVSSLVCLF